MRSLLHDFKVVEKKHPNLSSYMTLAKAVKGRNYSKRIIAKYFTKLVDSEDYAKSDRQTLCDNLVQLSKSTEESLS